MLRKLILGLVAIATATTLSVGSASAEIHPRPVWTDAIIAAEGSTGWRVTAVQTRLAGLGYYRAPITGRFGSATTTAVKALQAAKKIPVTGMVDDTTSTTLSSAYSAAQRVIALKPGMNSATVKDAQLRLVTLGLLPVSRADGSYGSQTTAAVTQFQAAWKLPQTGTLDWVSLNMLKYAAPTATGVAPGVLDPRCLTGHAMCIDKTTRKLYWVVSGKVTKVMDARFGAVATPTREGQFAVYFTSRDHVSSLYNSAMPFAMFFSGGQAVHYSADFAARGYLGASHGCVNIRDYNGIKWLFDQVKIGDKVVVYRS